MSVTQLPRIVSGTVTFSNRDLVLPFAFPAEAPSWVIRGFKAKVEGRGEVDLHPRFSCNDGTDSHGEMFENEHGLNAEFLLERPHFELLQSAALSAADLQIVVGFAARNEMVETLMLSIQHKTA